MEVDRIVRVRSSNLLGKITVLVFICYLTLPAQGKYGGGTGEPNDPYLIYDANHMNAIGADTNDWDKCFKLTDDVNLAQYSGTEFNVIGTDSHPFTGIFDGNNHAIWNFTFDSNNNSCIGLFGFVEDGNILNLGLIDPNVVTRYYHVTGRVGSLVGDVFDGNITNCYSEGGSVAGFVCVYNAGGLVGRNQNGIINNCYSTTSVSLPSVHDPYCGTPPPPQLSGVGGLVGNNFCGTITNCFAWGDVTSEKSVVGGLVGTNYEGIVTSCSSTGSVYGHWGVGGLAGSNQHGIITNCHATGVVTGPVRSGGLVGNNDRGTITNCYAWAYVTSEKSIVGGLVGSNYNYGQITNCHAKGIVEGNGEVGGLVGENWSGIITNCYARSIVEGNDVVGGLVGSNYRDSIIANSFSSGRVVGDANVGGLVGTNYCMIHYCSAITDSYWDLETSGKSNMCGSQEEGAIGCDPNYGKTTAEMMQQSTFTDWDFINVWNIGENQTYPHLRVYLAGDINKDRIVNFLDIAITANQWMEEQ